jgi:Skp family chaperone for outer membrane proteins
MKIIRLIVAALFVTAIASISAFAQGGATKTPATQTQPTQTAPANTNVNVPVIKIAFIDSRYFSVEKEGITRYLIAAKNLEREFKPRFDELQQLAAQIQAKQDEIQKLANSPVVDQKTIQIKQEEGQRMERDFKYKQEEAKALFQRKQRETLGPIEDDISKALMAFAKQRGITALVDLGTEASIPWIMVDPSLDITKAFIAEYNAKNPGTSASTTTPGTTPTRP